MSKHLFSRFTPTGVKKTINAFGHGFLDTLDDAFFMLPFSSRKQAELIRQEKCIPEDFWQTRRSLLSAEHQQKDARQQLRESWKQWISQDEFAERRAKEMEDAPEAAPETLPEYEF
jgi:hypothetical protein